MLDVPPTLPAIESVQLERACCEGVAGVAEVAAVGLPPPGGGPEHLVLFVVLLADAAGPAGAATQLVEQLQQRCQEAITSRVNPLFQVGTAAAPPECPCRCSTTGFPGV